jgi:hypothetical protein
MTEHYCPLTCDTSSTVSYTYVSEKPAASILRAKNLTIHAPRFSETVRTHLPTKRHFPDNPTQQVHETTTDF